MNRQQQAPAAAALPEPKVAYDHLFGNVHVRTFFGRLAQHGLQPTNEKQAQEYLDIAGKLRVVEQDPRVKAAEAHDDPVAQANAALDNVMGRYGFNKAARAQEAEVARRQAAVKLAGDASIYNSVLSLKAAEASQLAAELSLSA